MRLRIATWNIERPRSGKTKKITALEDRMNAIDADIWILTEAHADVSPGDEYSCVATSTINNSRTHTPGENRTTIWSRLPIKEEIVTHDPETAACARIDTPLGLMIIYGTVIPYHAAGTKYPYRSSGMEILGKKAWQLHEESIGLHEADCRRIQSIYPDDHFCFGGDLNQNRDGRRWYGTKKVRELLTETLKVCNLTCVTAKDFVESGHLKSRSTVDHLCLSEGLTKSVTSIGAWDPEHYEPGKRLSDHGGVWVDLKED